MIFSKTLRIAPALVLSAATIIACGPEAATVTPEPAPAPAPEPAPEVAKAPERQYPEPPGPTAARPVNFPEYTEFALPNGLKVYIVENHEVPLVSAQLVIRAGTMDDEHVADFTASMLGEGTKKRKKAAIDEAIEFVGGSLSSGAGTHTTTVSSRVLKKDLALALELLADEVQNPAFPEDALKKQQDAAKTALDSAKSQPGVLASTLFGTLAYPTDHPYGRAFPTNEDIDGVKIDDIKKFHETFYRPNNSFLILSGDVSKADVEKLVKKYLGKWEPIEEAKLPPNPLKKFNNYKVADKLVFHVVDRPASAQSEIVVGNLTMARRHDDWIKFSVANTILGGDATGRLFQDIREERGLTYGIYSGVSAGMAPGAFTISTRTKTKKTGEMLSAIFEHIEKIRAEEPGDQEFDTVVKKIVGKFPLQIETAGAVAGRVRTQLVFGLDKDYWKNYRDEVTKVTKADVKATAAKYVHPIPHVVLVGKAKKVDPQIKEKFPNAEIVHYDVDLKRID